MRIARAIQRVKRQAKQGGLEALRTGLGEELRSGSIPGPFRGAARRIAALLDPSNGSQTVPAEPLVSARPSPEPAPVVEVQSVRATPPERANQLGSDRGDDPRAQPEEPAEETRVDPLEVGATPVVNATPAEVAPVDATPDDVSVTDATPVPLTTLEAVPAQPAESETEQPTPAAGALEEPAKAKKDAEGAKKSGGGAKKRTNSTPPPGHGEEKLAPVEEAAKSAARSGSRGASKRSGSSGGKTSKKKK